MYRKRYFGLGLASRVWIYRPEVGNDRSKKTRQSAGFLCEVCRHLGGSRGSLGDELQIGPMGLIKLTEHDSPLLCGCDRLGWI